MSMEWMSAGLLLLKRRDESGGGCGSLGCFIFILLIGGVLYFLFKGRKDKEEQLGASKRAMGSGPLTEHAFACPYAKCPTCGAAGDKAKQQWDGLRQVTWTCGYCGNQMGIQELKDEELPPSARQRLGLDAPPPGMQAQQGYYPDQGPGMGGGGMGGLLTGMMIGSMMGGGHHDYDGGNRHEGGWDDSGNAGNSSGDWNDGGDSGSSDSGGDWGDSGGDSGDSGGSDW